MTTDPAPFPELTDDQLAAGSPNPADLGEVLAALKADAAAKGYEPKPHLAATVQDALAQMAAVTAAAGDLNPISAASAKAVAAMSLNYTNVMKPLLDSLAASLPKQNLDRVLEGIHFPEFAAISRDIAKQTELFTRVAVPKMSLPRVETAKLFAVSPSRVSQIATAPPTSIPPSSADPVPLESVLQSTTASTEDVIATIERLADLHERGILTAAEFQAKKTELLERL